MAQNAQPNPSVRSTVPLDVIPKCKACKAHFDQDKKLPHFLSCGHTFCKGCVSKKIIGTDVFCSSCGKFWLHDQNFSAHITNFALLDYMQLVETDTNHRPECNICLQQYNTTDRKPDLMTCGHGFCRQCISTFYNNSDNNVIKCPNCQKVFGVNTIQKGLLNQSMFEIVKLHKSSEYNGIMLSFLQRLRVMIEAMEIPNVHYLLEKVDGTGIGLIDDEMTISQKMKSIATTFILAITDGSDGSENEEKMSLKATLNSIRDLFTAAPHSDESQKYIDLWLTALGTSDKNVAASNVQGGISALLNSMSQ